MSLTEGEGTREPLLESSHDEANEQEHSYTEFYARLGTREDELTLGSGEPRRGSTTSSSQDHESTILAPDRASTTSDTVMAPLRSVVSSFRQRKKPSAVSLGILCTAVILVIILISWALSGSKEISPPDWEPALAYEVSFVIRLPSGLEEPGVVMVDDKTGKMRLSYYSGMTTYIYNEDGPNWSLVPVVDHLHCIVEHSRMRLPEIFPDLSRFKFARTRSLFLRNRRGLPGPETAAPTETFEWIYRAPNMSHGEYAGTYKLWTNPKLNHIPVRFSFLGRGVVLGAYHYDNYTIDYYDYRDLSGEGGVDPFWLKPPHGMPCRNISQYRRPPVQSSVGVQSSENVDEMHLASKVAQSWRMYFPEEGDLRDMAYAEFHRTMSAKEASPERALLFHQTRRMVELHNRDVSKPYKLGLNLFADWTLEERLSATRRGLKREFWKFLPHSNCTIEPLDDLLKELEAVKLPDAIDYLDKGVVLHPREQGSCGTSWALAVTGAIEAKMAQKTAKPPIPLSNQNLIDCASIRGFSQFRCPTGLDYVGYDWLIQNNDGQLATHESYPRLDQPGFCHYDIKRNLVSEGAHSMPGAPRVTKCFHVSEAFKEFNTSEHFRAEDLIKAFNLRLHTHGPLAVSINVSPDFFFYASGVYNVSSSCSSEAPDLEHGMLAVGYNLGNNPVPYTFLRNSWGTFWGEGGYVKIAQQNNMCGVATAATYVEVD